MSARRGADSPTDFPASLPDHLVHFLGPMGENADLLDELLRLVVDDHVHWRRNYFPQDLPLMRSSDRRRQHDARDQLRDQVTRLAAELRRSFPFHSPRYIAHQQSEISLPTIVGAVAGMLYNSNNVTSESGQVTLEMEIEAVSAIMDMVGFTPPPRPPDAPVSADELADYRARLAQPFGWGHLTSGGTSANMEALWAARNVRFGALAAARAAAALEVDFEVVAADGKRLPISALPEAEVLRLSPRMAVELPALLLRAAAARTDAEPANSDGAERPEPTTDAWSAFSTHVRDLPKLLAGWEPAVFATGAAHYSVRKALDVLGLGSQCLIKVETDSRHRMSIDDLRAKLDAAIEQGKVLLAVIGIAGTTEEGAIDPIDEIVALRAHYEREHGHSFWIHTDAAWGGYFLSTLRQPPSEQFRLWIDRVALATGITARTDANALESGQWLAPLWSHAETDEQQASLAAALEAVRSGRWDVARRLVLRALLPPAEGQASIETTDQADLIDRAVAFLQEPPYRRGDASVESVAKTRTIVSADNPVPATVTLPRRADRPVVRALAAIGDADSVTIDPHKMGYQPYPCGAVVFRSDRVRDFVRQSAPYITSLGGDDVVSQPLRHLEEREGVYRRIVDAPAVFTLEGSRPSSPSTALWLSTRVLPLDQAGHGTLVRSSWRAAQDLFSWLCQFGTVRDHLLPGGDGAAVFDLVPLSRQVDGSPAAPDTNLVIFGPSVRNSAPFTLAQYNALTEAIYRRFSILAEHGDDRHSYAQPFFLSSTEFGRDNYPTDSIRPSAVALGIADFDSAYGEHGHEMKVLRATVMNPYLESVTDRGAGSDLIREFLTAVTAAMRAAWPAIAGTPNGN